MGYKLTVFKKAFGMKSYRQANLSDYILLGGPSRHTSGQVWDVGGIVSF